MSGAHAFLAPSSASSWGPGGCPAFPRMASAFPEDGDTAAAREGEAAHHWLTEVVRGRPVGVGSLAPNGHPITDEMVECGADMLTDMLALIGTPGVRFAVEQEIKMPRVHPTLNWGRADWGAVDEVNRVIYNWDFKYGHRSVDAFENWQCVDYIEGLANLFMVTLDETWTVDIRIYQPRSYSPDGPVKRWTYDGAQHHGHIADLHAAAMTATKPDAPMSTGKHCTYCPARHACPALLKVGGVAMDVSLQGVPHVIEPANAGVLLRMVQTARERLEDLETGLAEQIKAALRSGAGVPGWALEQGYGRERWTQTIDDVVAMGDMLGKDLRKPTEAITPAQARKKGIDDAVISAYSEKPPGELKLKPVEGKAVRKAFQ